MACTVYLAAYFSILVSQDLGVIPALAHKVEAAHNVGIVTVASLYCTLQAHCKQSREQHMPSLESRSKLLQQRSGPVACIVHKRTTNMAAAYMAASALQAISVVTHAVMNSAWQTVNHVSTENMSDRVFWD